MHLQLTQCVFTFCICVGIYSIREDNSGSSGGLLSKLLLKAGPAVRSEQGAPSFMQLGLGNLPGVEAV